MSTRRPVIKKVFVTIYYNGRKRTFLCDAAQVGKHFQVSMEAWNQMSRKINAPPRATYSLG